MSTSNHDDPPDGFPELALLRSGDDAAWTAAFRRLWPIALSAAWTSDAALTHAEAEEAASEALAAVSRRIGQVQTAGQLKALVAIIAKRRAIDAARAKSASKRGPANLSLHSESGKEDPGLEPRAPEVEPGAELELAELAVLLQQAMSTLGPQERSLLNGQLVEGLTQQKLSHRFGLPIGTVGSSIARALKKIRQNLEKSPDLMQVLTDFLR